MRQRTRYYELRSRGVRRESRGRSNARSDDSLRSVGRRSWNGRSDTVISSMLVRTGESFGAVSGRVGGGGVGGGGVGGGRVGGVGGVAGSRRVVSRTEMKLLHQSFSGSSNISAGFSSSEDAGLVVSELRREIASAFDETENKGNQSEFEMREKGGED